MIDIKFLRENPEIVKENIRKKFQDDKLSMVDEVLEMDKKTRAAQSEADAIRRDKNKISKEIGPLMGKLKKAEKSGDAAALAEAQAAVDAKKAQVAANEERLQELDRIKTEADEIIKNIFILDQRTEIH